MFSSHQAPLWSLILVLGTVNCRELKTEFPKTMPVVAKHYQEPNICPYLKLKSGENNLLAWTCTVPQQIQYCGAPSEFEYDCCPGFIKNSQLGKDTCGEIQSAWRSIPDFLNTYSYPKIGAFLNKTLVAQVEKTAASVYTAFVPFTDNAFSSNPTNYESSKESPNPVLMSVTPNRHYSIGLKDGTVLPSMYNGHNIKITTYSNNLIFVECQLLRKPDIETRNGIIHFIDKPIVAHTAKANQDSLMKTLMDNSETSAFAADIPADVKKQLEQAESRNWFTVLAPTKSAWAKIKSTYSGKASDIARNHIVPKIFCSNSISEKSLKISSLAGQVHEIGFDCEANGDKFVLDACGKRVKIVNADIMAGNGVVQIIDSALTPTSVMDFNEAANCAAQGMGHDVTQTIKDLESCGIKIGDNTLALLPVGYAQDWFKTYEPFSEEYKKFTNDKTYRCDTYKYHMLKLEGELKNLPASWWNQIQFKTEYNKPNVFANNYYVKYRNGSKLYFENSRALNLNAIPYKSGFIYFIDRVNVIPSKTRVEILSDRTDMSAISKKISEASYGSKLTNSGPKSLFLAARNRGWKKRGESKYSGQTLDKYLKLHHVKLRYWGDDIGYFERETYQTVQTELKDLSGDGFFELKFKRTPNGNMYIGYESLPESDWALVLEWNHYGTDGIIWVIDWPIACPPGYCDSLTLPETVYHTVYAAACISKEGVSTDAEFDRSPVDIARKNKDKCVVLKMPPKITFNEWDVKTYE